MQGNVQLADSICKKLHSNLVWTRSGGLGHFPIQIPVKARIRIYIPVFPFLLLQVDGVLADAFGLCEIAIFRLNVRWLPLQAIVVEL